jgi:hypothetical protein
MRSGLKVLIFRESRVPYLSKKGYIISVSPDGATRNDMTPNFQAKTTVRLP